MFLRFNTRHKDGKTHRYCSVVENHRLRSGQTTQRTVLYLGEINDVEQAAWRKSLEAINETAQQAGQICLFPEDREIFAGRIILFEGFIVKQGQRLRAVLRVEMQF